MAVENRVVALERIWPRVRAVSILLLPGEDEATAVQRELQRLGIRADRALVSVHYCCSKRGDELFDPLKSQGFNVEPRPTDDEEEN